MTPRFSIPSGGTIPESSATGRVRPRLFQGDQAMRVIFRRLASVFRPGPIRASRQGDLESHVPGSSQANRTVFRPRRGVALLFVLTFVIAMAALAMSSIFMMSNANLLAKSYDRERDLKYAEIGRAHV